MAPLDQHDVDEDGEHEPSECELCIEREFSVTNQCRCGNCCEGLHIEATLRDAKREPRIKAECKTQRDFNEVNGYVLNDPTNDYACHFFDRVRRLCTIYETRPLCCRTYCCDLLNHRFREAAELEVDGNGPALDLGSEIPGDCREAILKITSNVPVSPCPKQESSHRRFGRMNQVGQIAEISADDWQDGVESRVVPLSAKCCFVVRTTASEWRFYWRVGGHFYSRQLLHEEAEPILEALRWLAHTERP